MTYADVLRERLRNLCVSRTTFAEPQDVVGWLGAVQSQEYPAAKWAVGARARGLTDAALDRAFDAGRLLRTHVMRPTWHFVLPADIRWMLDLTGPRVRTSTQSRNRQLKLDDRVFDRTNAAIAGALRGGRALTRQQLGTVLREAGLTSTRDDPQRLTFIVLRAELDGVVCSGPRAGRQLTYALLDERVPSQCRLGSREAQAELARRYFRSHGPATLRDFMWWSGLRAADARAGLEAIRDMLVDRGMDGKIYWSAKGRGVRPPGTCHAYLLTTWDECFVAYRDRAPADSGVGIRFSRDWGPRVLVDGAIAGAWRREETRGRVVVEVRPFRSFRRPQREAIARAAERYGRFLQAPVTVRFV